MSRLDSFIRRVSAQRDILNAVAAQTLLPNEGDILELGLGNGRTYNHLCELFPGRRIIAFDRTMLAHASSIPDARNLVLGEIKATAGDFMGKNAAMVHADIGTGYAENDALTLLWLPALAAEILAPGGIAMSGLPLESPALAQLPIPHGIDRQRYFLYRRSEHV